ncbi:LVIVD repeat-containing protein [Edaphobacter bradus]|uniref:hypothetical protein n=1 Tax=Edaphobacter bradus TaxID=2259016 RepID=UPI0021DF9448|nr:hypothetical protein [Edaphobacter bradus]
MNKLTLNRIAISLVGIATIFAPLVGNAEVHSRSKEIVVMDSRDLPEEAELPGNSFFLHSDNAGSTYLYVEQQQGARLSVFDVSDPGRIKLVSTTKLATPGAFDFRRPLDGSAELVRFRDGQNVGVLDLRKPRKPSLRVVTALADSGSMQSLGESGLLAVSNQRYSYARAVPRDYQVIDLSTPSDPTLLTTVKQVRHQLVNAETGTTFLLGRDGLTVVRRVNVENEYKSHLMQMQVN